MSRSRGETPFTTAPPIPIRPEVGRSSPATSRRAVDFPQPDGPTRIMNSPSWIVSVRSSRATTPPAKTLPTSSYRTSATRLPLQPRRSDAADEVPLGEEEQDQDRR